MTNNDTQTLDVPTSTIIEIENELTNTASDLRALTIDLNHSLNASQHRWLNTLETTITDCRNALHDLHCDGCSSSV